MKTVQIAKNAKRKRIFFLKQMKTGVTHNDTYHYISSQLHKNMKTHYLPIAQNDRKQEVNFLNIILAFLMNTQEDQQKQKHFMLRCIFFIFVLY